MRELVRWGLVVLLFSGCAAPHVSTRRDSQPWAPERSPWRTTRTEALPPTLPQPREGEGLLVGSLAVYTKEGASCGWEDVGFYRLTARQDERSFRGSFIGARGVRLSFDRKDQEGEFFAFTLPAGRYVIDRASATCFEGGDGANTFVSSKFMSFEFMVAQGDVTYLGAIAFARGDTQRRVYVLSDGANFVIENQWDRDSRLLEFHYPLRNWSETVMSSLSGRLIETPDEAPVRRTLEHLLLEPLASAVAPEALEKACEDGVAEACFNLGVRFAPGAGAATNEYRAAPLFEKACEGGVGPGCFNLGTFYLQGWGVKAHVGYAAQFFGKACKQGTSLGCLSMGRMYEEGLGGTYLPQDKKKAETLYERACTNGLAEGCFALGLFSLKQGNRLDAGTWLEKSCAGGYPRGCFAAAQLKQQ